MAENSETIDTMLGLTQQQPASQLLTPEEIGDGVDWDALNKANANKLTAQQPQQKEEQVAVEKEKEEKWNDGDLYNSAEAYFLNVADLSAELDTI